MNTLILCGKQNIALREHGDAGRGGNQGNFHALLKFRLDAGDTTLESHFKTAGRNAQYTSPTIQKDLLVCIGEWIRNRIVVEVLESKFFSVCADEAADTANRVQMALIVRFGDKQGHIRQEFLDFIRCNEGTTGRALSGKVIPSLQDNGLDMNYLVVRATTEREIWQASVKGLQLILLPYIQRLYTATAQLMFSIYVLLQLAKSKL